MVTQQLSIFLENKAGRLNDVAALLGKAGVNMTAFSLADNSDFGILRVIVSDPHKAQEVLKAQKFAVSLTDVIHLQIANTPGSLSNVLAVLADAGMYIEYMYAFSEGNRANVIIKPDNVPNAVEALQAHKIM
ncbi:MAG TPA: amino acid-binding protein [Paludibacteraceae bacterium]|nr:amino acid-binding protein [Paludibacteraceae bacterium]